MSLNIVKLGGTVLDGPHLRAWLDAIARAPGEVIVVPGGGRFAMAVRAAQGVMGFDDATAHDMALLAMTQFGVALSALAKLPLAETERELNRFLEAGETPVWLPWPMLRDAPEIAKSRDVTSDSLSLWLATRQRARRLILAKAQPVPVDATIETLVADGIVDRAFPGFLTGFVGSVTIIGPEPPEDFETAPARAIG